MVVAPPQKPKNLWYGIIFSGRIQLKIADCCPLQDGSDESDKLTTCDVYLIARKKTEVQLSDPVKNLLDSALDMNFSVSIQF